MTSEDAMATFVSKWTASGASERANKDAFLLDLCAVLGVPRPDPTTGDTERDRYVFERDALTVHEGGVVTTRKIDLYRDGSFILEAKQGSDLGSKKLGTAKRDTPAWNIEMQKAYGQALGYARSFDAPVPFLVICDLGYCFDLYASFDGTHNYRPFPNAQGSRLFIADLAKHAGTLRTIWEDPRSLDPLLRSAKITREVAGHLAALAKTLDAAGHPAESVATFLMRCLFTMFAEDVGLLPERLFTDAIEKLWLPHPASFPGGIETLWRAMNEGSHFGFVGKLLRFNGGLFAIPSALPLDRNALALLLEAAKCDWSEVEPSIFGTLLERALDPKERHQLGAHYTPRAYVERLVRPTIEEPLRAEWDVVRAEVVTLVAAGSQAAGTKAGDAKLREAIDAVKAFHRRLVETRVLDPACGTGNFLYVTLDVFKRLESEILGLLAQLGEKQQLLSMDTIHVTPSQFLGIEVKRWAKEIAELVLWIGYLQWHFRLYGRTLPVPEPVLQDYKNIECRDAVLAWDSSELVRDAQGKPVTRWDGETTKKSPVTGDAVPDEAAQVVVYEYLNPRKAKWPKADFIVGNPPFIGASAMRSAKGEGYTEAVRKAYPDVPESADFVMYWWHKAAELARTKSIRRFGFITTNSLRQTFNRRVLERHLTATDPLSLLYAVPDHPWVDAASGAQVRIGMTVGEAGVAHGVVDHVVAERSVRGEGLDVDLARSKGRIHADLRIGADVASAGPLRANLGLSTPGVKLHGAGFIVTPEEAAALGLGRIPGLESHIRPYRNGRDLTQTPRGVMVIDLFGLTAEDVRHRYPEVYQWVLERVKPERDQNSREGYRRNWWTFGEPRRELRQALADPPRFIATVETAKHRVFQFLDASIAPDNMLIAIALADAFHLGVLSSRAHVVWALAAGGRLGVGNDPRYNKTRCFDPFPFPVATVAQQKRIADLAESLDTHRKARQAAHPDLTLTGMYNVLEKLRAAEPLTDKDRVIHEHGLVSLLKQFHDEIDAAVFDAYGWPHDLTGEQILEKVVALNAERAEEERGGLVRWLRPEFQNPGGTRELAQVDLAGTEEDENAERAAPSSAATAWPKKLPAQIAAVRDLMLRGKSWSLEQVSGAFKGAKEKDVEAVLDSLAALGLLTTFEANGPRWQAAKA